MGQRTSRQTSRRGFLKAAGFTTALAAIPQGLLAEKTGSAAHKRFRSKTLGCFMGAAIADAMGGPVECQHYMRIARNFPDFQNHLPYNTPGTTMRLKPGYALDPDAGSITDDTFIRMDLARYMLETEPPYTAVAFAPWLLKHGDLSNWWPTAVRPLKGIEQGEVAAAEAGLNHKQGGGGAWWQPVAIFYAGDPRKASSVAADMCRIWKAPLEQDILSSVVAGQAEAFKAGSTIDSIVNAVLADSGPLAKKLFTRAVEIAKKAKNRIDLYENLYHHCLVKTCSTEVDGPMPPHMEPVVKLKGAYNGILFAEQQPLALAYFYFGQGDPYKTVITAVKGGRDADSITCNSAAWLGAMSGLEVWPRKWIDTVQQANLKRMNLMETGNRLSRKALKLGHVRLDLI